MFRAPTAAGELWRCRFDVERNIIVVNSGHRDFVFATRNRALQLRYLVRLYVKELLLKNFAGLPADQLLERMITHPRLFEFPSWKKAVAEFTYASSTVRLISSDNGKMIVGAIGCARLRVSTI